MGESSLPCGTSTRERLEEMRGENFRSWDAFLNYLGDMFEEYDEEYANSGFDDGVADLESLASSVETVEERTGRIERTLEELQR